MSFLGKGWAEGREHGWAGPPVDGELEKLVWYSDVAWCIGSRTSSIRAWRRPTRKAGLVAESSAGAMSRMGMDVLCELPTYHTNARGTW